MDSKCFMFIFLFRFESMFLQVLLDIITFRSQRFEETWCGDTSIHLGEHLILNLWSGNIKISSTFENLFQQYYLIINLSNLWIFSCQAQNTFLLIYLLCEIFKLHRLLELQICLNNILDFLKLCLLTIIVETFNGVPQRINYIRLRNILSFLLSIFVAFLLFRRKTFICSDSWRFIKAIRLW